MSVYVGVVYNFLNNRSGDLTIYEAKLLVKYLLNSQFNMDIGSDYIQIEDKDFEKLNDYLEDGGAEDLFIMRLKKIAKYNYKLNGGEDKNAT